jgi:hypothetical protein
VTAVWTACLPAAFWLVSCKTGPAPPKMGTPPWYWAAAREQYAIGDFVKTQEHLEKLMEGESQYKARAATWHLVVLAGMARGFRELADAYEEGAPFAKAQTAEFRRTVNDLRRQSRTYTIGLAEEASRWQKDLASAEKVTMEFAFPIGSPAEPPLLMNVRKGILPPDPDRAKLHRESIARGVLLQTSAVAGEEPPKAAELFKTQPVEVPRAVFLHGMADSLVAQSALFDRKRLQEPDKKKILLELAAAFAKAAAEAPGDDALKKKIKDLQARIEKEQKSIGKV